MLSKLQISSSKTQEIKIANTRKKQRTQLINCFYNQGNSDPKFKDYTKIQSHAVVGYI
jgi:hypothetical protein